MAVAALGVFAGRARVTHIVIRGSAQTGGGADNVNGHAGQRKVCVIGLFHGYFR